MQNFKKKKYKKLIHKYVYDIQNKKLFQNMDLAYKKIKDLWQDQVQLDNPRFSYITGLLLTRVNLKKKKKIKILDVGCGYGSFVHYLNSLKKLNVIGTDISSYAIKKGRQKYKTNKIFVHNFLDKPFVNKKKFDFVLILGTFWFLLKKFNIFINNLKKNLNKNTEIFFQINIPKDNNIFKSIISNETQLVKFLKKYFKIKNILKISNLSEKNNKLFKDYDFLIIIVTIK